ncbi:Planctomycete cytochrome C [Aquisphaera giovannonii]|uniref:Planctomycete cytochrome C n=1 Tax=Aquisphaera giovannonii TaxID=406548 RepID=A0A5B9W4M3_9BACT|nr:PSD1 and planctomycete cytochrome C domain-containing protein [Aquisphaera giovannonii]QEH35169.1 Planctomycete cytochrome C [Aquisphaera giovannonii]
METVRGTGRRAATSSNVASRTRETVAMAIAAVFAAIGISPDGMAGEAAGPEQVRYFETEIRPLLATSCMGCHGAGKQKGGLRLDSKAAIVAGGDSGPAVVPGRPGESLLVEAVNYASDDLKMPPNGQLNEAQRAALSRWIAMGMPWPEADSRAASAPTTVPAKRPRITDEDRAFWSFQPLRRPDVPAVDDGGWGRNPIDRFLFAGLKAAGLSPAPEADRRVLIRRLSFDLRGLPPTPEEVEAFVADPADDAYEALVGRMLASPRYGERWGRHWLDLVRYAESDGYRADDYRPEAWRYRDYVIKAFNEDRPYDRFILEQLAGDEIDPDDPELRIAVGFLRLGTYEHNQRDVPGQWATILNEITDVTGDVFLGLGMGCARCHDHKFDPILQKDYYRLQAFFAPIALRDDLGLASDAERRRYEDALAAWEAKTADIRAEIAALERPYLEQLGGGALAKFPAEMREILDRPAARRTPLEEQLAQLAYRQVTEEHDKIDAVMKKGKDAPAYKQLLSRLAAHDRDRPKAPPRPPTVTDVGPVAPPTTIPGDRAKRPVEPGFLTLLDPEPARVDRPAAAPSSTGRRTALARWLTRADNPLSTRVAVNRVWQYHFGRGLVGTSSDFGRLGERPSHPDLLDWLAAEFVAHGWSLKHLHRLIVTSTAYRQASGHPSPELAQKLDPENRLLWHWSTRRLEVEPIRDAMLAASGELDLAAMGGPASVHAEPRRSVYTKVMRNTRDPLSEAFDGPDGSITTPRRDATVTPIQALLMINGSWPMARARAMAARLSATASDDLGRIDLAYRLAFGRDPSPDERGDAIAFLHDQALRAAPPSTASSKGAADALVDLCHALLNSSEFLYVD